MRLDTLINIVFAVSVIGVYKAAAGKSKHPHFLFAISLIRILYLHLSNYLQKINLLVRPQWLPP